MLLPSVSFAEIEDFVIEEYTSETSPFEFEIRPQDNDLMKSSRSVTRQVNNLSDLQEEIHYNLSNYEYNFSIRYTGNISNLVNQVKYIIDDIFASDVYLYRTMSNWGYSYTTSGMITFTANYLTNKSQETYVDREVSRIVSEIIDPDMNDLFKVKAINDYIVLNAEYSTDSIASPHTAYALLNEGKAVCQGYALAAYKMLEEAGIEVRYVVGKGNGGGHAWNLVARKTNQ